ncbi:hypothetical protein [Atopomonas sediminilitoris]|uniref:hypothetical protein n=1 Tax=Atopomonas sediminilitoris TaxID=2919919 RepID=UPI001F4D3735|nr:hypothetical protein [Atopomonas sediminilitoris]MCJ8170923.1 hypothetical protein [Atopomonas sediminilitoris]
MHMILTKFKEKLPKGFSYPIGAEKISAGLASAPQLENLVLNFWHKDEFWASSYNERIKQKKPLKIIEIRYQNPTAGISSPQHMIEAGYYSPSWLIYVYAAPKEYLSEIKEQLANVALPEMEKWLNQVGLTEEKISMVKSYIYDPCSKKLTERV